MENSEKIESEYGTSWLDSEDDMVAGTFVTRSIIYEAGSLGMDDGSTLKIATNMTSDWGPPQFSDPSGDNFCQVETTGDAHLKAEYNEQGHIRPWKPTVDIHVFDGSLGQGDVIRLKLGVKDHGSMGIRAQSFVEDDFRFKILVDSFGTGDFIKLPNDLTVNVVAGRANRLRAVVPTTAEKGEELSMLVKAEDYWGNVATGYSGNLLIRNLDNGEMVSLEKEVEGGMAKIPVKFGSEGTYRLEVSDRDRELNTVSNPVQILKSQSSSIFWGDMHGQSGETVGTGTVEQYFHFAKDKAFLDFASHAGNDFQITDQLWDKIRESVKDFNSPGDFITFLCYEWSANTPNGGDHNVYFLHDQEEIDKSSSWQTKEGLEKHEGTYPVRKLYDLYRGREDVLIIPHQGGRPATLREFDDDLSPLVETVSTWGVFEWFGQRALEKGYKIGFSGGSDDHTGRPGATYPTNETGWNFNINGGLLAVHADVLTRDSIWKAIKERKCYVTTGARIRLDVSINQTRMGGEVQVSNKPKIDLEVAGTAPIQRLDLFRGSSIVSSVDLSEGENLLEFIWSGARSKDRNKVLDWSGGLSVDKGEISEIESFGFDHPQQGIKQVTDTSLRWHSASSGNYQGVRVNLEAPESAILSFSTEPFSREFKLADLARERIITEGNPEKRLEIRRTGEASAWQTEFSFEDEPNKKGIYPYYVRVRQKDGEMAWSSPIFAEVV